MKSIIISLLDTRTPILVKLGKLLKKRGFKVYYFSNENFDKEEITMIAEMQGQILSKGTLSIVGLPDEYK